MYKISKNENFGKFGPLIKHCPHWINFTILTFISEKNRYFRCPCKIWNKFISFDMKKKGGGPKNESLCFKWGTPTILGPI